METQPVIPEISSSYLDRDNDYPEGGFPCLSSVSQENARIVGLSKIITRRFQAVLNPRRRVFLEEAELLVLYAT
jgi:hypothetical protein